MRILCVEPAGRKLGGAERSLAGLINGLTSRGHAVAVLTQPGSDAIDLFGSAGADVVTSAALQQLSAGTRHGGRLEFVTRAATVAPAAKAATRAIVSEARHFRADVVHSNGFRTHVLAPLIRAQGINTSWSLRDFAPRALQQRILRGAARGTSLILANSEFTASQIYRGHPRVRVVGNPVVLETLPNRADAREALGLTPGQRAVAVVGHLHPSKGQHIVVEAVEAMLRDPRYANTTLLLAGGAVYGEASQRYETELRARCGNNVRLLGAVSGIESIYAAVDVVVQPSIHPEGFGRSVVEAQLAGVPVIATAIGGARELVASGTSGILVAVNNANAIRSAIENVFSDANFERSLIKHGHTAALRFNPDSHVDVVERAFQELERQ